LIGGDSSKVGSSDGLCGRTMRANVGRTSSATAATAAAACWLMGIAGVLSSIDADSEAAAAERRHTGRHDIVSPERSTAHLPWPTAIVGQFSLLQFNQLCFNYPELFSLFTVYFRNPEGKFYKYRS